ncbi:MAG: hypothetical protein BMS9Abin05_0751 [Rhodothermia bacterium]|nr:MAG: hypothetical protein BMS9Abin05_0751 [Rhodothermia bacterium]
MRLILDEAGMLQNLEHAVSLWYYDMGGPVRTLHRRLKFREGYRLGRTLGRAIAQQLLAVAGAGQKRVPDLIVPVPLHPIRALERGFNQSEALAEGIGIELGASVSPNALGRRSLTSSQVQLSRAERLKNLSGAFSLASAEKMLGRHVLIVDDVITTGATMLAAIDVLEGAPVERCSVASLALVRPT